MANTALSAPVASAKAGEWGALVSAYRNAASERNAAAPNDWKDAAQESAWEKLVDRASAALAVVTKHPVTTLAQLAEKCALVKAEYPDADCMDGDDCAAIIADVQRIASPDAPAAAGENPALVAAFEQYRAAAQIFRNDPEAQMSGSQDAEVYALMDPADAAMLAEPALTPAGAAMKLRRLFIPFVNERWADEAIFDDRSPAFAEGVRMGQMYEQMLWAVIEDLQRIAADQQAARLANGGAAWDSALAEYRAAWALWDTLAPGYSDEESNAVAAVALPAIEAMIATPAPNAAALAIKIEEARKDQREVTSDDLDAILADVRRLAAMED